MFYECKRGRIGMISFEELQEDYVMYHFPRSTVEECEGNPYNFRSDTIVKRDLIFVVLDLVHLPDVFGEKDRIALYIRADLCLIVMVKDENGTIQSLFRKVMDHYETERQGISQSLPEEFLYHFLEMLIREDRRFLENMEMNMSILETQILKEQVNASFINQILQLRKELMLLWNYYEQLMDLGEVLRDNENDMFTPDMVRKFASYTERTKRLGENVQHLKEYTVQLRETHDAMLDYHQNNIMKLLTVITTIFLPLTLIVGWYGMNFRYMPELNWKYGYAGVIVFSVLVVVFCFIAFKKHKLL